jgi:hypothetical protein
MLVSRMASANIKPRLSLVSSSKILEIDSTSEQFQITG